MNTMSDHQTKANVNSKDAVAAAAVWRSPEIIKALTSTVTTCFVLGFAPNIGYLFTWAFEACVYCVTLSLTTIWAGGSVLSTQFYTSVSGQ